MHKAHQSFVSVTFTPVSCALSAFSPTCSKRKLSWKSRFSDLVRVRVRVSVSVSVRVRLEVRARSEPSL